MGEQDSARLAEAADGEDHQSESTPLLSPAVRLGIRAPSPPPPAQHISNGKQQHHHHRHHRQKPARLYRRRVLVTLFSVLILIELGTVIIQAPINAIMEDNICRQHLALGGGGGPAADRGTDLGPGLLLDDPRCKDADVQGELAMVRGAQLAFDVVPNLAGAIPYGLAADMYGRKPVLALGLLGVCLGYAWTAAVLALPSVLPLRAVYLASAFTFIGSFGCAGIALFWTFLADVTPQAARAGVFFHAAVAFLVAEMAGGPLSAWLLTRSPWLAMLVGLAASFASIVVMYFVPETLGLRLDDDDGDDGGQEGSRRPESIIDDDDDGDGDAPLLDPTKPADPDAASSSSWPVLRRTLTLAGASFRELWVFVLGNSRLAVLMVPLALFLLGRLAQESLLQYATKRYGLTWADATMLMTARSLANLVLFVTVFPALGRLCLGRLRMSPLRKDLSLARVAGAVGTLGALLVAVSPTPGALMCYNKKPSSSSPSATASPPSSARSSTPSSSSATSPCSTAASPSSRCAAPSSPPRACRPPWGSASAWAGPGSACPSCWPPSASPPPRPPSAPSDCPRTRTARRIRRSRDRSRSRSPRAGARTAPGIIEWRD
ncbi:hypothetical protein RB597_008852 [Gaeumannomyces tritici]